MIEISTLQNGFMFLLSLFMFGAVGSLIFRRNDNLANIWSSFFAILGSSAGLFLAGVIITGQNNLSFTLPYSVLPILPLSFNIDKLSAFFVFTISLIALFSSIYSFGYVKHYYKKYSIGTLGFFYNMFILGMLLVVTASNGIFFLVAWEVMSIVSYFLVVYDRNEQSNVDAGFLYLVMTHIGTGFIILAFLLFYKFTNSFDFAVIKSGVSGIPLFIKNIIFVLTIIGFGTKSGIIPFHIWLPSAHPSAPSHVSALMSGVMIKTGIYMMIRILLDILNPIPLWWGLALLILGSVSSILGVLYALTEHDIKKLLAYHSIENIGIILLGLGSALTFSTLGMPILALLGLVSALFHTLNHAIFKSLLFLSAGSVINETHTRNIEEYGGLIKRMPQTALFFLIGSMAISALPPFNGFFSEWLTYQSLFHGMMAVDPMVAWIFIVATGALALTGGLALACFVKAFGSTFLARPRGNEAEHAKESSMYMLFGMGGLAVSTLVFGVFSGYVVSLLEGVGRDLGVMQNSLNTLSPSLFSMDRGLGLGTDFGSVSAPAFFALLVIVFFVVMFIFQSLINRKQKVLVGATWDCGTDLTPRMEITSTGFARSIVVIFKRFAVKGVYQSYIYQPLLETVEEISQYAKSIQIGNVNVYILYIFIALMMALFLLI